MTNTDAEIYKEHIKYKHPDWTDNDIDLILETIESVLSILE